MGFLGAMIAKYDSTHAVTVLADKVSEALVAIDHTQFAVHQGVHYYMEGYAELDDTDTLYIKLVTPDTSIRGHFQWEISSSGVLTTELYMGASGGMTGGTGVTPLNSDHNSSNTSTLTITKGVTAPTSTGTTVSSAKMGSSSGGWSAVISGGATNPGKEIILKQNTTYCRKFLSGSDGNTVYFFVSWAEGSSKN